MHGHTLGVSRGRSDFVPRSRAERCWIDGDLIRLGAWPVGGVRPGGRAGPVPWLIDLSVLETAMRSVYGDRFRLGARAPLLQMAANLLAEGDRRNAEAFAAKVSFPLPDYPGRFHEACAKHLAWGAAHRPGNAPIDVAAWVERAVALEQKFDPNQPRVPRGHSDGGQWTDADGASGSSDLDRPISEEEWEETKRLVEESRNILNEARAGGLLHLVGGQSKPPPRWHNLPDGPESSDLLPPNLPEPKIPVLPRMDPKNPLTNGQRTRWTINEHEKIRLMARRWGVWTVILERLAEKIPNAYTYFNDPKSLKELQDDAQRLGAGPGYQIHHIIEQTQANPRGLDLQEERNIVRIPTMRHQLISDHYSSKIKGFGGLTVRQWVRTQSFEVQRAYGLYILRRYGVLKPRD